MVAACMPGSVTEALEVKKKERERALFVAGGTDIMPARQTAPVMIYLQGLPGLSEVSKSKEILRIGAGCNYAQLIGDERVPQVLRDAMRRIAAPAIRNAGTLVGNICRASPAGDTLPVLYVLEAVVVAGRLSEDGGICERRTSIENFIQGNRRTALQADEIVLSVEIPCSSYETMTKMQSCKVGGRNAQAIAKLSFAGICKVEDNVLQDVRIAFGAVGPTVVRNRELEAKLKGFALAELAAKKDEIRKDYAALLQPMDDQRSTAAYRRRVCLNLMEDFLDEPHLINTP